MGVKQSVHMGKDACFEGKCGGFKTGVNNLHPENAGWNNSERIRQAPGGHAGGPYDGQRRVITARVRGCRCPLNDPSAARAALNAFLRGVERRGVVFAEWQGGDADAGDAALAATLRGFGEVADGIPFAEWPRRFWAMLLAAPGLRGSASTVATPALDAAPGHLARLGGGPRAALLLRLVAGLAEAEAAAVLGVGRPTYRLALQRALPHRADGSPDPDAWRAMSEAAQVALRAVPAERLQRIALLRDGRRPKPRAVATAPAADARPRWLWPASLAVVALTGAALAATWWWPGSRAAGDVQAPRIQTQALPPAAAPASRFDPVLALQTDRDLDLLLAQVTAGDETEMDPAFDAWLVTALANDANSDAALQPPPQAVDADESVPEQFDAPR